MQYGVRRNDQRIDLDEVRTLAREHRPKLIWVGHSAYPRQLDVAALAEIAAEVAPEGTTVTWVDQRWLLDQGEDGGSLPLWGEDDPWIAANAASPAAAATTGLAPRPLRSSVRDVREHGGPPSGAGGAIDRERERELLAAWRAR